MIPGKHQDLKRIACNLFLDEWASGTHISMIDDYDLYHHIVRRNYDHLPDNQMIKDNLDMIRRLYDEIRFIDHSKEQC